MLKNKKEGLTPKGLPAPLDGITNAPEELRVTSPWGKLTMRASATNLSGAYKPLLHELGTQLSPLIIIIY